MYRRGPFWGGPYMRRRGFPLLFPMGGFGMGMGGGMGGMGGGLLGDLAAGGIGYLMGRQSAQQAPAQQYQAPPQQYPQYQTPPYQPQQVAQYQPPAGVPNQQAPAASRGHERLAQLKLLG